MPQNSMISIHTTRMCPIVAHERTVCLVTHAGANSINEAIRFGVPLVAMPFFHDQQYVSCTAVAVAC